MPSSNRSLLPARLAAIALLVAAGTGCSSSKSQSATTKPASDVGTTERERDMRRATSSIGGYPAALGMQLTWLFNDLSDTISGAPGRYARLMETPNNPEYQRQGINGLADRPWGQGKPYTTRYGQIATDQSADYLVRATAIRALNRSRDASQIPLFIKSLNDSNEMVRLEACKALNRMPHADAVPGLLKLVAKTDEGKDVRIAAAEALRHYKRIDAARTLAGLLSNSDFSLVWQARRSLEDITRKDFGYNQAAWLNYLTNPERPLS